MTAKAADKLKSDGWKIVETSGFLHLIGYDHDKDDGAEAMETLEQEILAQLGIPNPYADRDPHAEGKRMD